MQKIIAILKTIRTPNLILMGVCMYFIRLFIIVPQLRSLEMSPTLSDFNFALLVIGTLLIAAAGYMINDYFDIKIDQINKPKENYFQHLLDRRGAIILHFILNAIALIIGLYLAYTLGKFKLLLLQILPIGLLWFYSTHYKKQFLIGNVVIAFLSALIVIVPAFYEKIMYPPYYSDELVYVYFLFKILAAYGLCIFLITLIREAVKDMEDMEGDAHYRCRTMPIVWGISRTKWYIYTLQVILVLFIGYLAYKLYQVAYMDFFYMTIVFIIFPLFYTMYLLYQAQAKSEFKQISTFYKIIILLGILSMFKISYIIAN